MRPLWRSLLFVPADDEQRLAKVATRGADAVIIDLEDAVAIDRKAAARRSVNGATSMIAQAGCPVVVRINSLWRDVTADLDAAVHPGVAAIMAPKVEDAARLTVIGEMVRELARERGLAEAPGLIALIESPVGLRQIDAIAAVPGVIGLALGTEDFSLALGVPPSPQCLDLPCRQIALAAAVRGQMAIGLPISIATIKDEAAWADAIAAAKAIGMTGALCIHPAQIGPVNGGFSPGAAEVDRARRVLAAWDNAQGASVITLDGRMIDLPVVLAARKVVALAV
ncbi:CoA ester lyase [Sphingobium phenoxybenzoativorans]|uniref:CoA ester lyase n=1 Tax=Sphingobium phenoxybenzoativorans TaxID=1592790 RepID=A0A975Q2T6_9SPHN|nr:CoA ester lyase [Sphingobium phenoxybenzoativorans]QUT06778.1 CoA ester lyase [Sphingobium phenoxybenzoativorans]